MARGKKKEALTPEERLQAALVPDWEQPYKVPENWCWVTLDSINQYQSSSIDPSKHPNDFFELYSVPSSADDYPEIAMGSEIGSTKQRVEKGDVLLCKINPRINRVWKVSQYTENALLASSEWIIIRNSKIHSDYLMHCFRTPYFREYMLSNVSGVGGSLMRAQPKYVKTYPLPLPPLPEQQRIVDRIESLFAKLDEAKQKVQDALDSFETRKAAILHKAFTGELTAQWRKEHGVGMESWENLQWGNFIISVEAGKNWNAEGRPPQANEFGVVKVSAVTWGEFNEVESKTCTVEEQWNKNVQIHEGDFLFSRANTLQLVGNCVIVKSISRRLMLSDKILRFKFDKRVIPDYVLHFTRSNLYRNQIEQLASGNQDGMRNVSQKNMKLVEFPIPKLNEQTEIVRILDDFLAKEQQAKEAAEAVLEQIDLIKKSILARAFRGELGTNDPAEESAVELVKEVIKRSAENNSKPQTKVKRTVIPKEIKSTLSNSNEEEIIKLLMKSAPKPVSVQMIMSISKKKFELMDALRNLEQKQIVMKNSSGEYLLKR